MTARKLLDDRDRDGRYAAHLAACPACRAALSFERRVAGAVAEMPRARAPHTLAAGVMAEIRARESARRRETTPAPLALRTWELGWVGGLAVALVALLPWLFDGLLGSSLLWEQSSPAAHWPLALGEIARGSVASAHGDGLRLLAEIGPAVAGYVSGWPGSSSVWLCGAAAFAVSLYLLLSWRHESPTEDAHA